MKGLLRQLDPPVQHPVHSKATNTSWNITKTDIRSCPLAWIEGPAMGLVTPPMACDEHT